MANFLNFYFVILFFNDLNRIFFFLLPVDIVFHQQKCLLKIKFEKPFIYLFGGHKRGQRAPSLEFATILNAGIIQGNIKPYPVKHGPTSLDLSIPSRFFPTHFGLPCLPDLSPFHLGTMPVPHLGPVPSRTPTHLMGSISWPRKILETIIHAMHPTDGHGMGKAELLSSMCHSSSTTV
jgi:hypothetical protein